MLAEIATQLGIDSTIYTQFAVITVFYFVISGVFLKPHQRLFELREQRTSGAIKEAQELSQKAEVMYESYIARMKDVRGKMRAIIKKNEDDAKAEAVKLLDVAASDARARVQGAQKELDLQKGALLQSLNSDAASIAQIIVGKVLGRAVSGLK